jgi:hypothetical protein
MKESGDDKASTRLRCTAIRLLESAKFELASEVSGSWVCVDMYNAMQCYKYCTVCILVLPQPSAFNLGFDRDLKFESREKVKAKAEPKSRSSRVKEMRSVNSNGERNIGT